MFQHGYQKPYIVPEGGAGGPDHAVPSIIRNTSPKPLRPPPTHTPHTPNLTRAWRRLGCESRRPPSSSSATWRAPRALLLTVLSMLDVARWAPGVEACWRLLTALCCVCFSAVHAGSQCCGCTPCVSWASPITILPMNKLDVQAGEGSIVTPFHASAPSHCCLTSS